MVDKSAVPRPWSQEEDDLLKQAISTHGDEPGVWKIIAESVPGRTNKACRKRWLHSLSPLVRKTPWTPAEDALLLKLYATHQPPRWSLIARQIPGRTDDACSKRYREALDPRLKRDSWSANEDAKLLELTKQLGSKWTQVGQAMGRSGLGCRNRWRLLERKQRAKKAYNNPSPEVQPYVQETSESLFPDVVASEDCASSNATEQSSSPTFPFDTTPSDNFHVETNEMDYRTQDEEQIFTPVVHPTTLDHYCHLQPVHCPISIVSSSLSDALVPSVCSSSSQLYANSLNSSHPWIGSELSSVGQVCHNSLLPDPTVDSHQGDSPFSFNEEFCRSSPSTHHNLGPALTYVSHDDDDNHSMNYTNDPDPSPRLRLIEDTENGSSLVMNTLKQTRKRGRINKSAAQEQEQPRLSSHLPADLDRTILPYACGHSACWPPSAHTGSSRFATASELTGHRKIVHGGGDSADVNANESCKPFKCALQGCGKAWKNINGIQYHLQISKAHFQTALIEKRVQTLPSGAAVPDDANADQNQPTENGVHHDNGVVKLPNVRKSQPTTKEFPCPYNGCPKSYKQRTGLQYHLDHGHPKDIAQLQVIPPTLMRKTGL